MNTQFVICIDNHGYSGSLEVRKIYERLVGESNDESLVRVVDESGEDYLYPADKFVAVDLPEEVRSALRRAH
jgi:hypothetical protein